MSNWIEAVVPVGARGGEGLWRVMLLCEAHERARQRDGRNEENKVSSAEAGLVDGSRDT